MTEPAATVGPYSMLEVLHRGPRAVLYLAAHPDTDRDVVIKMPVEPSPGEFDSVADPRVSGRLLHRNIARVLDHGEANGAPYLVLERLHGRTLRELMADASWTADVPTRIDLIAQLCTGLHHAHEQHIVHANIRPDNIFITDDGVAKILNFGASTSNDRTMVSDNALAGSFEYMSPEQIIARDAIDGRSDIFSAAVILYELVSGRRPFQGGSTPATLARILRDDAPPLEGLDRLTALLRRALEKEPAKRFLSAQEFAYALWMMEMPAVAVEADVSDDDPDASRTMYAEPRPEKAAADTDDEAAAGTRLLESKQMLIYAAVAGAVVIAGALAFVSC